MSRYKRNWDDLADMDPFWAVLSDPGRRYGQWDQAEFFRTGQQDVEALMQRAVRLGLPHQRTDALDFGCGVGRIAESLTARFARYCGVDVSEAMIRRAQKLARPGGNLNFVVIQGTGPLPFSDGAFDLIYSKYVLQHLSRDIINFQVRELVRVLRRRGLLVFQLPTHIPLLNRIQPRRRCYEILRTAGVSRKFLYESLGLHPSRMTSIAEQQVSHLLTASGAELVEVEQASVCEGKYKSATYYATKR